MAFSVVDESTWDLASDSVFVLNGKTFLNGTNEEFTEKEITKAIDDVIRGLSSHVEAREIIQKIGRKDFIKHLLDNLNIGMGFADSIGETIHWMNNFDSNDVIILSESGTFEIFDISTWDYASQHKPFVWKDEHIFFNSSTGKDITEKEMVLALRNIINTLESLVHTREQMSLIGFTGMINLIMDKFSKGGSANEAIEAVSDAIYKREDEIVRTNKNNKTVEMFEIFDVNTWNHATSRPFFWKDKMLFSAKDRSIISEKDLADLLRAMFNFLERDGKKLSLTQRTQAITHLLDRMEKFQSDPILMKEIEEEE